MDLQKKVPTSPNACRIGLFTSGIPIPAVNASSSNFFDTLISTDQEADIYTTSGSLKFKEVSKQTAAGTVFTQTVEFSLPTTDELRAERILQFFKVKFISVKLTNGKILFFGRNDVAQNSKPKIKVASNEKLTKIQYQQKSIYPLGFSTQNAFIFQDGTPILFQDGSNFN